MARQPVVHEGVVRREQIEDTAVVADDVVEEELRLAPHVVGDLLVVVREVERIGPDPVEVLEPEPLRGEAGAQRLGARVGEHAPHLVLERFLIRKLVLRGKRQQWLVRNAPPQEE